MHLPHAPQPIHHDHHDVQVQFNVQGQYPGQQPHITVGYGPSAGVDVALLATELAVEAAVIHQQHEEIAHSIAIQNQVAANASYSIAAQENLAAEIAINNAIINNDIATEIAFNAAVQNAEVANQLAYNMSVQNEIAADIAIQQAVAADIAYDTEVQHKSTGYTDNSFIENQQIAADVNLGAAEQNQAASEFAVNVALAEVASDPYDPSAQAALDIAVAQEEIAADLVYQAEVVDDNAYNAPPEQDYDADA